MGTLWQLYSSAHAGMSENHWRQNIHIVGTISAQLCACLLCCTCFHLRGESTHSSGNDQPAHEHYRTRSCVLVTDTALYRQHAVWQNGIVCFFDILEMSWVQLFFWVKRTWQWEAKFKRQKNKLENYRMFVICKHFPYMFVFANPFLSPYLNKRRVIYSPV